MVRFVRSAGFTPVVLAALLAAGCAAPTPTAVMPASGTPPIADPAPALQAPTPGAPAAQATGVPLAGRAELDGPVKNTPLTLIDLATGLKVPASQLVGEARTDAEGRFSFRLMGSMPGKVYRMVAPLGPDAALTCIILVTETGLRLLGDDKPSPYRVSSLPDESQAFLDNHSDIITKMYVAGGTAAIDDATVQGATTDEQTTEDSPPAGGDTTEQVDQPGSDLETQNEYFDNMSGVRQELSLNQLSGTDLANATYGNVDPSTGASKSQAVDDRLVARVAPKERLKKTYSAYLKRVQAQMSRLPANSVKKLYTYKLTGFGSSATVEKNGVKVSRGGSSLNLDDQNAFNQKSSSHSSSSPQATAPTLTALSAATGSTAGGATITLTGTDFTGATAVTFGATAATDVHVVSATELTATVPAHAAGPVDVAVTTPGGTATSAASFTYVAPATISALTPTSSATEGDVSVTITGTNFTGATAVSFGGTPATSFLVDSATQITATAPAHGGGNVSVAVTTPAGTESSSMDFFYEAELTISGLSSPSLPAGQPTTIDGTGFTGATEVLFGSVSVVPTVTSDSTIDVTVPAGVEGLVSVTVTTPRATKTLADAFTGLPSGGGFGDLPTGDLPDGFGP